MPVSPGPSSPSGDGLLEGAYFCFGGVSHECLNEQVHPGQAWSRRGGLLGDRAACVSRTESPHRPWDGLKRSPLQPPDSAIPPTAVSGLPGAAGSKGSRGLGVSVSSSGTDQVGQRCTWGWRPPPLCGSPPAEPARLWAGQDYVRSQVTCAAGAGLLRRAEWKSKSQSLLPQSPEEGQAEVDRCMWAAPSILKGGSQLVLLWPSDEGGSASLGAGGSRGCVLGP